MKQRKKSFGMRISAFVLSFAMVCTLLAGVNVVAFAADDNDLIVSVHSFYNDATKGGDGEHLYTKDADEMSWLSSLPTWNDEDEAWKAPVSSSLAVYRVYNPNSGEHHYAAADEAEWLVSQGWTQEKIAFYSDDNMGVPIYRLWNGGEGVGSHYYTTDEGEAAYLASIGWTAEGVNFYGVKEEEPGEKEMVAMQTGANEITVVSEVPFEEGVEFEVSHGLIEDTVIDTKFDDDNCTATLTLDEAIEEDTYVVECSDEEYEPASFEGQEAELTDVVIGENLIFYSLDEANNKIEYRANMQPVDQWGDDFEVAFDKVVVGTFDDVDYDDGVLKVTVAADKALVEGTQYPVSVVKDTFVKTGTVTVSAASMVANMFVSPIMMTEAEALINQTGRIDVADVSPQAFDADEKEFYYFGVIATDQYGNILTGEQLNKMLGDETLLFSNNNVLNPGGFLDVDGNVIMPVVGDGKTSGEALINIVSLSGAKATATATIAENEKIDKITFNTADLQEGKIKPAMATATNQFGEAVDLYNEVSFVDSNGDPLDEFDLTNPYGTVYGEIYFMYVGGDINGALGLGTFADKESYIKCDANLNIGYAEDDDLEQTGFVVAGLNAGPAIITVAGGKTNIDIKTYKVAAATTVAKIGNYVGLNDSAEKGKPIYLIDEDAITFLDSNGDLIDQSNPVPYYELLGANWQYLAKNAAQPTVASPSSIVITAQVKDDSLEWDDTTDGLLRAKATATAGNHSVDVKLYKADAQGNLGKAISSKTFTFKVFNDEDTNVTYTATMDGLGLSELGSMMYVNANSGSSVTFTVYKTDSNGATVECDDYWVDSDSVNIATSANGKAIDGQHSFMVTANTVETTEVTVFVGTKEVETFTLAYSDIASMPTAAYVYDEDGELSTLESFDGVTNVNYSNGVVTVTDKYGNDYELTVVDQYGEYVDAAVWNVNGKALAGVLNAKETYLITTQLATTTATFVVTIGDENVTVTNN